MKPELLSTIAAAAEADEAFVLHEVQSLWSGYGQIVRVGLKGGTRQSLIVKWVEPPLLGQSQHPRGFGGELSHVRKLRSYEVEGCFYRSYSHELKQARVAHCLLSLEQEKGWLFVLDDLDAQGFSGRTAAPNELQLRGCLRWLAELHAQFMGRIPDGLWEEGSYWHLATRPEEWRVLPEGVLKQHGEKWAEALRSCPYQTVIHGDAKIANFCLGEAEQVAAVDFQYVGGGVGVKDLAYFLSSVFIEEELEVRAPACLDLYFSLLKSALARCVNSAADEELKRLSTDEGFSQLEKSWRALYPIAWADFYRFLAGWSPGHYKMHAYSERMTQVAVELG